MKASAFVLLMTTVASAGAQQVSVGSIESPPADALRAEVPPLRLAESLELHPMHALEEAPQGSLDSLMALAAWNEAGNLPLRDGFSRPLPSSIGWRVELTREELTDTPHRLGGGWWASDLPRRVVWGTSLYVPHAYRLRLELRDVDLPEDTELWVWSETGETVKFDLSLIGPDRTLWTPSVAGPVIYLEMTVPTQDDGLHSGLQVASALQQFELDYRGRPLTDPALINRVTTSCLIDAACISDANVPGVSQWKKGIAHLRYVKNASSYICTGGLLNNTRSDFTPYFLTANHCFSTQDSASSLEAYWDYIDSSCLGSAPLSAHSLGRTDLPYSPREQALISHSFG